MESSPRRDSKLSKVNELQVYRPVNRRSYIPVYDTDDQNVQRCFATSTTAYTPNDTYRAATKITKVSRPRVL